MAEERLNTQNNLDFLRIFEPNVKRENTLRFGVPVYMLLPMNYISTDRQFT